MTPLMPLALLACAQGLIVGGGGGASAGDDTGPAPQAEACDAPMACEPAVELACAGPETALDPVPGPSVCPEHAVTDDAPDGFPVGARSPSPTRPPARPAPPRSSCSTPPPRW